MGPSAGCYDFFSTANTIDFLTLRLPLLIDSPSLIAN